MYMRNVTSHIGVFALLAACYINLSPPKVHAQAKGNDITDLYVDDDSVMASEKDGAIHLEHEDGARALLMVLSPDKGLPSPEEATAELMKIIKARSYDRSCPGASIGRVEDIQGAVEAYGFPDLKTGYGSYIYTGGYKNGCIIGLMANANSQILIFGNQPEFTETSDQLFMLSKIIRVGEGLLENKTVRDQFYQKSQRASGAPTASASSKKSSSTSNIINKNYKWIETPVIAANNGGYVSRYNAQMMWEGKAKDFAEVIAFVLPGTFQETEEQIISSSLKNPIIQKNIEGCQQLHAAKPTKLENNNGTLIAAGRLAQDTDSLNCFALVQKNESAQKVIFIFGKTYFDIADIFPLTLKIQAAAPSGTPLSSSDIGTIRAIDVEATQKAQQANAVQPVTSAQPVATATISPTQREGSNSVSLKAAMDAIPVAHRPIGIGVAEGEWDSYNMMTEYNFYALYPGGIALNMKCPIDPKTPPSRRNCGKTQWTKKDGKIYIDGKKGSDDAASDIYFGFKPGERVSVDFGNISGGSAGGQFTGTTSVVAGDTLKMDVSGNIAIGSWSGASYNGPDAGVYSGGEKSAVGEYYLDGYILAIKDKNGNISFGTITKMNKSEGGYIYVNGTQYWE